MTAPPFRIELLGDAHDRAEFRCGEAALDRYFQTQATPDMRRRVANCFAAVEQSTGKGAAFYTLSAASIPILDLPPEETKRLPRYPSLPAVLIGRMAVDERFQGHGLGAALLMNAVARTMQADAAAFTLLFDAKNEHAVKFCQRYGFRPLTSQPRKLFLPLATARKALASR